MAIFPFFNQKKPRPFHYQSIYRDERKEELQRKVEKVREELKGQKERTVDDVKQDMRGAIVSQSSTLRNRQRRTGNNQGRLRQNWILLLVLALLLVLMWRWYFA